MLGYIAQVLLTLFLTYVMQLYTKSQRVYNISLRPGTILSAFKVANSTRQAGMLEFPMLSPLA